MDPLPPILLAEDDENDVILFKLALSTAGLSHPVAVASNGREAIDYLAGNPPYSNRALYPLPAAIILDVKMPRTNGFELLSWLGQRPELAHIPAIVLTSSSLIEDVARANELGARDYFVKPRSIHELVEVIRTMCRRWFAGNPPQSPTSPT